jgi:hypothetical protein
MRDREYNESVGVSDSAGSREIKKAVESTRVKDGGRQSRRIQIYWELQRRGNNKSIGQWRR